MSDNSSTPSARKSTARDFFVYLTATAALYVSIGSLITLLFQYIDRLFPDFTHFVDPYQGPARFAIATLVVIFPLYIYFTRKLNNDMRADSSRMELPVRRWLLYLTLFIAGLTLVIDLVVLLNTFLGGEELTAAFLLKVAVVFIVIGGAFWYYLKDLQGRWNTDEKSSKMIGAGVSVAVALAIVSGFLIMGSPQTMRQLRIDQQRVDHLNSIQWEVITYYQTRARLPESLADLSDPIRNYVPQTDPETNTQYEYLKNDALSFSLCATFNREGNSVHESYAQPYPSINDSWEHSAGRHCFERTIDPLLYRPAADTPGVKAPVPMR